MSVPITIVVAVGLGCVVHQGRKVDAGDGATRGVGVLVGERRRAVEGGEELMRPPGRSRARSEGGDVPFVVLGAASVVARGTVVDCV